jgi:hypothetical protein
MKKLQRKIRTLFIISILFLTKNLIASPQLPDYLIYKGDTIPIYTLILEKHFERIEKSDKGELFGLKFRDGASLNCWRGYQAIYSIENDSLFLKNIIDCGEEKIDFINSKSRIRDIFKEKFKNEKVFIDWFSGDLSLPSGKLLRWDGVFHKSFENEILLRIKNGKLKNTSKIDNYIDKPNRINRKYGDTISKVLFKKLLKKNWINKYDFDCSEKYLITIGKNGKVNDVSMIEFKTKREIDEYWEKGEYKFCINSVLKGLTGLRFDILKKNGKPIEEKVYLDIWIEDNGKLENWTD